jgi:hypothetical protein
MAGIVNRPLSIFRRPESPKPLHSRWGDVAISVPTDGSWNQYDNPHRVPRRPAYGPGFVPDCSPSDRNLHQGNEKATEENNKSTSTSSTLSRHNSLSLGSLRPGRLSVRLASRPKHLRGESPAERDSQTDQKKPDFAYKPIQQDYPTEVSETSSQSIPRYRYIPASGPYLEDIPGSVPRSQSARSCRRSRARRDSLSESQEDEERDRNARMPAPSRASTHQEDDRQSLRSSLGDSSDGAGSRLSFGLPPRRRTPPFVPADRKRSSSLKPMTLAMVPDPDELY